MTEARKIIIMNINNNNYVKICTLASDCKQNQIDETTSVINKKWTLTKPSTMRLYKK